MKLTAGTVGGLIGVANASTNGLAIKGSMTMNVNLKASEEMEYKANYGLIFVASIYYAVGCLFIFSNSIVKVAGVGAEYFTTSDEQDKICLIYKDGKIIFKDNRNNSEQSRPFSISFLQGLV